MIYSIIPAGGKGVRSGYQIPKQYVKVLGKEVLAYTLEVFQKTKEIDEIIIAAEENYFKNIEKIKVNYKIKKLKNVVIGGKERQDSVLNALSSLKANKKDLIVVHDAARPLLPQSILKNAISTASVKGNAVVCLKARDTLIKGNSFIEDYIDRSTVYYVQTPQIFNYKDLMDAMLKASEDSFLGTDESMLVKRIGKKINIVEGSLQNFKITSKEDIELFKKIVSSNN